MSPTPASGADSERGFSAFTEISRLYSRHLRTAVSVTLLVLGVRAMNIAYPKLLETAIDVARGRASVSLSLGYLACVTAGVLLLHALLAFESGRLREKLGVKVLADLRRAIYARLIRERPEWFKDHPAAELVARLGGDGVSIVALTEVGAIVLGELVQTVGALALMLAIDVQMTLLSLSAIPVIGGLSALIARSLRRHSRSVRSAEASASAHVQRTLDGIETVQAYRQEAAEQSGYESRVETILRHEYSIASWSGAFNGLLALGTGLPFLVVVWFGGRSIAEGGASAGGVAAFLMYLVIVSNSARSLAGSWGTLQRTLGQVEELLKLAQHRSVRPTGGVGGRALESEVLALEGVTFAYPDAPLEPVAMDIWLQLRRGKSLALVGRSGAGKSTLTKLLMRFVDPSFGRIVIDGIDISTIRLDDYRSLIGYVPQSPALFPGTIAENIAYGFRDASREKIEAAAARAHADTFIRRLPQGYDTDIGEQGGRLSGGQRQRIALARAILLAPPFLILDEVTSHLDAESESAIGNAIRELAEEHGVLVIAHRLNSVRRADEVVVMDHGRIVEVGTHESLMRQNKLYRHLAELQMHDSQLEAEVTGLYQGDI